MARSCGSVLIALALVSAVPAWLSAQSSFDLGPTLGYYLPTGRFEPASVYVTSLPRRPADLRGPAVGGQAHLWLNRRVGIEIRAAVASSTIRGVATPGGMSSPTRARVFTAEALGLWNLLPLSERSRFWLSAGPGLVRHGGDAYADFGSPVDAAGVMGVGAAIRLVGRLRATGEASVLLYSFDLAMPPDLRLNPGSLQRGFQRDAQLQIGLGW
jgi:hypothetical protein